jgi:hypothetical protein
MSVFPEQRFRVSFDKICAALNFFDESFCHSDEGGI